MDSHGLFFVWRNIFYAYCIVASHVLIKETADSIMNDIWPVTDFQLNPISRDGIGLDLEWNEIFQM